MWIAELDIPQVLLDAAEAGKLVIFVGAGASRSDPSGLPDFGELVREIGIRAGRRPTDAEVRQPDVFLGRLEDSGVNVHQLVADAIDLPGSAPNRTHSAIVRLALAYPACRVVTTNYDRHLSTAAAARTSAIDVYEAPALPVGDDFHGVVHLHGSLNQPSRRLVVTDSDFGKAYLREAWAARFLERMFSAFSVLFVGYSHGDVVMQYLARSLGPSRNRYVLTDDAANGEWRRLGLMPISYPNATGDHAALPDGLERWADLATMGHVEHRARIADLASGEPPTIPEEVSYVEAALAHPERAKYFEEKAKFADTDRSLRWFAWVAQRPAFEAIFAPETASQATSKVLTAWIADEYILNEQRSSVALRAFSERSWPLDTWLLITHRLFAVQGQLPKWLGPWLELVLQHAPLRRVDLLDMMLANTDWADRFDLALMLFEDRTRPFVKRGMDFGEFTDPPRFEVDLCGDEYWLSQSWAKVFVPTLDQHLEPVLRLVTEQIARVYRSVRGLGSQSRLDVISASRSAIEEHGQDRHRDAIDVLIDAARDCIEFALAEDVAVASHFLSAWARSPDSLLRRLSVHGWRVRTDVSSDEKLNWLREQNWLWEASLHHEVYRLLGDALPLADDSTATWFVETAVAGPPNTPDPDRSRHASHNLLSWIAESRPALQVASTALNQAREQDPDLVPDEHPDFRTYGSFGVVEDAPLLSATELHERIADDASKVIESLRALRGVRFAITGPTWHGSLSALQACVASNPEDGIHVARVLDTEDAELRAAIVEGWDHAAMVATQVEQVLATISAWDLDEVRRPVADMFSNGGEAGHPTAWHQYEQARLIASRLWPTSRTSAETVIGSDILLEAINDPAGDLAEFWTKAVQWEWTKNEAAWQGMPQGLVTELDRLATSTSREGMLAQAFLAARLNFYFGADRAWCESRLLPLFDWSANEAQATSVWQGFLAWGRWNDGLLHAGLLDAYMMTLPHSLHLNEEVQRQLANHLSSIAMYAAVEPDTWLVKFVVESSAEFRVSWAHEVQRMLEGLGEAEATAQWDRWIDEYWSGRNRSVPRPFTPAEASVTASWVLSLPTVRAKAVDLALASPAGLEPQGGFLYQLSELDVEPEAHEWARLLTHLLRNTTRPDWAISHYLRNIVPKLRRGHPEPDLATLINEAMRLGASDAADW